jgi:hypothetical protein
VLLLGQARLALQKLCKHLNAGGGDLNANIKAMVANGLPVRVQQALDLVRVIGNQAVHPGYIDLRDTSDTALSLFSLLNIIVEEMITRPQEIDALYNSLPQSQRDQIEKRDAPATSTPPSS